MALTQVQKRMIFQDTVIFTIGLGEEGRSQILPRVLNGCYSGVTTSADDLAGVQSFLNSIDLNVKTVVEEIVEKIWNISDESFPEGS